MDFPCSHWYNEEKGGGPSGPARREKHTMTKGVRLVALALAVLLPALEEAGACFALLCAQKP